jgi:hypothetical protein
MGSAVPGSDHPRTITHAIVSAIKRDFITLSLSGALTWHRSSEIVLVGSSTSLGKLNMYRRCYSSHTDYADVNGGISF